jgi:prepilin-type N-terminal cleavage/methylation domain-containing protein
MQMLKKMNKMQSMKNQQSGFTLVEIAIVLVIIGLLLGGILKGQELINSAKVKNLAQDFKTVPLYIYGYQDRFKALPGDDARAATNLVTTPVNAAMLNGDGNGVINGAWNSITATAADESVLFWLAVRMANFAPGSTDFSASSLAASLPKNVDGGRIGITSNTTTGAPVANMTGTYAFCSGSLLGKYAKQLDTTLDDGNTATGSVRVIDNPAVPQAAPATAKANATVDDATTYTVCMTF